MREDYKRHKRAASLRSRSGINDFFSEDDGIFELSPSSRFSTTEAPDLASLEHFSLSPQNVSMKEKVFHSLLIAAGRCEPGNKESSSSPKRKISFKAKELTTVCDEDQENPPEEQGINLDIKGPYRTKKNEISLNFSPPTSSRASDNQASVLLRVGDRLRQLGQLERGLVVVEGAPAERVPAGGALQRNGAEGLDRHQHGDHHQHLHQQEHDHKRGGTHPATGRIFSQMQSQFGFGSDGSPIIRSWE